jgi:hypothetical protein
VPERIFVPSGEISPAGEEPPGRAALILDAMDRYFVLAADSSSARSLPEVAARCEFLEEALLSPDGNRLAVSGADDVLVLDFVTGHFRAYPVLPGGAVSTLAWSPDGRLLACVVEGDLALLEVPNGRVRTIDLEGEETGAVAFAPDSTRLAVDLDEGVGMVVLDDDFGVERLVSLPTDPDEELTGSAAWSPDGRLLAVELAREVPGEPDEEEYTVAFLDMAADEPRRSEHQFVVGGVEYLDLAGWRTPTQPLFLEHRPGGIALVVRDLTGAEREVLAVTGPDVFDIQLAPGLVPQLRTRVRLDRAP